MNARRWAAMGFGLGAIAVTSAAVGYRGAPPVGARPAAATVPECPITSETLVVDSLSSAQHHVITDVPLAGRFTHVPEFHDCQRFLVRRNARDTTLKYDSLYAVFASYRLERLGGESSVLNTVPTHQPTPGNALVDTGFVTPGNLQTFVAGYTPASAVSYVEIYSWGGTYPALGILPGFNCLYLSRGATGWSAVMAAVTDESVCLTPLDAVPSANIRSLKQLSVTRVPPVAVNGITLTAVDVPPVARWDWDPRTREQFVGVRCGDAWCNVARYSGPATDAVPTPIPAFANPASLVATNQERQRVLRIRGWFDYQRLARPVPGGQPVPSDVRGWIVPNPILDRVATPNVFHRWVHAATAVLSADYNNGLVSFGRGSNTIWICVENAEFSGCPGVATTGVTAKPSCPASTEIWWAKVMAPGRPDQYRRICRRDHSSMSAFGIMPVNGHMIPGTARWRWLVNDETTWKRCVDGCCELQ